MPDDFGSKLPILKPTGSSIAVPIIQTESKPALVNPRESQRHHPGTPCPDWAGIPRKTKMKTTIEFETTNPEVSPWSSAKARTHENLVLKPEYSERQLKFEEGTTWIRIVPAVKGSAFPWMLELKTLEFEGGRFTHPRSLKSKTSCVFDTAYAWALKNVPGALFSKSNPSGVRLLTDPYCAFWAIAEQQGQPVAKIFLGSAYDGSRGGVPGLGWRIWSLTQEKDETGQAVANPVDFENGVMVAVEKKQSPGAKYPSYNLRLGRQPAPMTDIIARMEPEELAAICPLENTIRLLTPEEQWKCLAKVMSPDHVAAIRKETGEMNEPEQS